MEKKKVLSLKINHWEKKKTLFYMWQAIERKAKKGFLILLNNSETEITISEPRFNEIYAISLNKNGNIKKITLF